MQIVLGVLNFSNDNVLDILNYLLLNTKLFIYNCKQKLSDVLFRNFLFVIKNNLEMEKITMYNNGEKMNLTINGQSLLQICKNM